MKFEYAKQIYAAQKLLGELTEQSDDLQQTCDENALTIEMHES